MSTNLNPISIGDLFGQSIACPACGSDYMHHGRVWIEMRDGEDCGGQLIFIDHRNAVHVFSDDGCGFLGRRDGIRIECTCEQCMKVFVFVIMQHKGITRIGWLA